MEAPTGQQTKISLITAPDIVYNLDLTFLLVYPSDNIKSQFQNLIENYAQNVNVYLYEHADNDAAIKWLLDILPRCNYAVLDIDNIPRMHTDIISYLLAHSNVFWLTNGENEVYNTISKNRIYNLDWLQQDINGEKFEETQQNPGR
jgi:hypothetical protein